MQVPAPVNETVLPEIEQLAALAGVAHELLTAPQVAEDLAAASAIAPETALYYSSATAVTVTAGTNIIGYSVHGPNHPGLQNRTSQGQLGDKGVTYLSTNRVRFVFRQSYSINSKFQRD